MDERVNGVKSDASSSSEEKNGDEAIDNDAEPKYIPIREVLIAEIQRNPAFIPNPPFDPFANDGRDDSSDNSYISDENDIVPQPIYYRPTAPGKSPPKTLICDVVEIADSDEESYNSENDLNTEDEEEEEAEESESDFELEEQSDFEEEAKDAESVEEEEEAAEEEDDDDDIEGADEGEDLNEQDLSKIDQSKKDLKRGSDISTNEYSSDSDSYQSPDTESNHSNSEEKATNLTKPSTMLHLEQRSDLNEKNNNSGEAAKETNIESVDRKLPQSDINAINNNSFSKYSVQADNEESKESDVQTIDGNAANDILMRSQGESGNHVDDSLNKSSMDNKIKTCNITDELKDLNPPNQEEHLITNPIVDAVNYPGLNRIANIDNFESSELDNSITSKKQSPAAENENIPENLATESNVNCKLDEALKCVDNFFKNDHKEMLSLNKEETFVSRKHKDPNLNEFSKCSTSSEENEPPAKKLKSYNTQTINNENNKNSSDKDISDLSDSEDSSKENSTEDEDSNLDDTIFGSNDIECNTLEEVSSNKHEPPLENTTQLKNNDESTRTKQLSEMSTNDLKKILENLGVKIKPVENNQQFIELQESLQMNTTEEMIQGSSENIPSLSSTKEVQTEESIPIDNLETDLSGEDIDDDDVEEYEVTIRKVSKQPKTKSERNKSSEFDQNGVSSKAIQTDPISNIVGRFVLSSESCHVCNRNYIFSSSKKLLQDEEAGSSPKYVRPNKNPTNVNVNLSSIPTNIKNEHEILNKHVGIPKSEEAKNDIEQLKYLISNASTNKVFKPPRFNYPIAKDTVVSLPGHLNFKDTIAAFPQAAFNMSDSDEAGAEEQMNSYIRNFSKQYSYQQQREIDNFNAHIEQNSREPFYYQPTPERARHCNLSANHNAVPFELPTDYDISQMQHLYRHFFKDSNKCAAFFHSLRELLRKSPSTSPNHNGQIDFEYPSHTSFLRNSRKRAYDCIAEDNRSDFNLLNQQENSDQFYEYEEPTTSCFMQQNGQFYQRNKMEDDEQSTSSRVTQQADEFCQPNRNNSIKKEEDEEQPTSSRVVKLNKYVVRKPENANTDLQSDDDHPSTSQPKRRRLDHSEMCLLVEGISVLSPADQKEFCKALDKVISEIHNDRTHEQ